MIKILISACLEGQPVRYDGKANGVEAKVWQKWQDEGRLISLCPEVAGGLETPRAPAEIISDAQSPNHLQVITIEGDNVTKAFKKGAQIAVDIALKEEIKIAILKAKSPSCGNQQIYDGSFSDKKIAGQGITASSLSKLNIKIFNENQLSEAEDYLKQLEEVSQQASAV